MYKRQELEPDNYGIAGLFLQHVILRNFYLQYGANLLGYYDHVPLSDLKQFDVDRLVNDQLLLGYGGKLTYKSFIGPISVGVHNNTLDGYVRYYFALGFSFNYQD